MIISRTPYRISFFGGGTDYPGWYNENGGAVLTTTIDKYCYLTCRYLPPFFEHRFRVVYSKIEHCQSLEEIEHPVVREALRYTETNRGMEIHHDGDLPARSGMGSSSSFTVGLLHALHALKGQMPSKRQLAMESIHLEQQVLKETVGVQDQLQTAHGGFNQIIFRQGGDFNLRPMTLPAERMQDLNDHLMLCFTGVERTASDVAQSYVPDLPNRERQLTAITDMVDEGVSILSNGRDLSGFGELLHEAWRMKRELSSVVSNSRVDEIYAQARAGGAIGGKLLGAGGGGFMVLFVPPASRSNVMDRLNGLIHVPFRFENSGSQIIFYDNEFDYSDESRLRDSQQIDAVRELAQIQALEQTPTA